MVIDHMTSSISIVLNVNFGTVSKRLFFLQLIMNTQQLETLKSLFYILSVAVVGQIPSNVLRLTLIFLLYRPPFI